MRIVESSRLCGRVAAFVLIAASTAGCSSDTTRFKDNPFSSPMAARRAPAPEVTGTVRERVDAQPLPPPVTTASRPAPVRRAELEPEHAPQPRVPPPARGWQAGPASHAPTEKSATAGATHVVARGETLLSISRHYGKHATEIAKANHLPAGIKLRI